MTANQILTDAQIAQFRRNGFVFLPGFYDAAATGEIVSWVDEVTAWPEAPGWHDRGRIGAAWTPLGEAEIAGMTFKPCPSRPGDAMLFDSFAPHRSAPNMTDTPRRALYITYNRASEGDQRARYFADKRAAFPPDIEREPGKTYKFRV